MDLAYDTEVEALPAFPILLKPYKWLIALYLLGGAMLVTAIIFVARLILEASKGHSFHNPKWFAILDLPSIILFVLIIVLVYLFAAKRIILESDKLTYRTWSRNEVLDFHDIANHKLVTGYLIVQRKSDGSTIKIPLEFHNICYLNETLKRWFGQLGQKHHFVYTN